MLIHVLSEETGGERRGKGPGSRAKSAFFQLNKSGLSLILSPSFPSSSLPTFLPPLSSLILSRFCERWKEAEQRQSHAQGFSLDEEQLRQDWAAVLALADQKGKSLEQTHIFALAHILRRPIIVYGVKVVKNFRGENLGFANFEGKWMYLTRCKPHLYDT